MRRVMGVFFSMLPFFVIAGLLWAALFLKPQVVGTSIKPAPIERRDKFYGIDLPAKDVIWAVGNNGKVVFSKDNGISWTVQGTPVRHHLQDIAAWDEQRAVAVGNEGTIIVTRDGGKTWNEVNPPRSEVANKLIRVRITADGDAWTVGSMGTVLLSKDNGATWQRKIKEQDVALNDITFIDSKIAWVVGEFGHMFHTTDGGLNWKQRDSPVKSSLNAIVFRDKAHGIAVGMEGVILKTDDGGNKWIQVSKVTSEHLFDVVWDGELWLSVGTKGTFLKGDKTGTGWKFGRLSEYDLSWHTKVIKKFGAVYMAGNTIGDLRDGKWHAFKSM